MSAFDLPLTDVAMPEEDVRAVLDCLRSGWLTMGPRTQAFEAAFAEAVGAEHAVAVSSGTAALHLALLAAGVGPGDEVIVPGLTFVAAAAAVRTCGADVVLCDVVGPADHNLDPADVAARITPRTRAIMATHWWGYACDTAALSALCEEHGLVLLEDCAQSVLAERADGTGKLVGTAGAAGCFSFFSKKQLCVGEGGMVVSDDEQLAAKVRSLRSHAMTSVTWDRHRGHAESYDILDFGFNYRLDEPRAALGLSRLGRLVDDLARRRAMAVAYRERLSGVDGVLVPWDDAVRFEGSSHFCFGILVEDEATRDRVRDALKDARIQTTAYPALTALTAYADLGPLPRVEEVAGRHLALPLAAGWGVAEVDRVVAVVQAAL